jgi:hypothetical protein
MTLISRRPSFRRGHSVAMALLCCLGAARQSAASSIALQDVLFNVNGTTYNTAVVPGLNDAGFDWATGLGTLVLAFSPGIAGTYYIDSYFDHEVHSPFYDEYGAVVGTGCGVSWQIDEPGLGDANRLGTIFANTSNNTLDNTNHIPGTTSNEFNDCGANGGGAVDPTCNNDVAMALGYAFTLAANERAVITLLLGESQPEAASISGTWAPPRPRRRTMSF